MATIISGVLLYFSNGIDGQLAALLWFAPVPVLVVAYTDAAKVAFTVSFFAFLIGRLSWLTYLISIMTLVPAVIYTILIPLISSLLVLASRFIVRKNNGWPAVLAFPVIYTGFEFLMFAISPDGTAGSIAYTQADFLPLIQIVSLTGVLGITFILSLFSSVISIAWINRNHFSRYRKPLVASVLTIIAVLVYGFIRLQAGNKSKQQLKVGLISADEKFHNRSNTPDTLKSKAALNEYSKLIAKAAASGAKLIVLPERAIDIDKQNQSATVSSIRELAMQNNVYLVIGCADYSGEKVHNSSLVVSNTGLTEVDYNKAHLIKGLETQFNPGNSIGVFKFNKLQTGTAICKDMDFGGYVRKYGLMQLNFLCVPAWDFTKDDWLHSRMAILRGVENGFSEVRTARQGRLTISDYYGRVVYEKNSSEGQTALLIGNVSLGGSATLYTRFGDWFAIANLLTAITLLALTIVKSRKGSNRFAA
ncbi:hypothetical protein GS399_09035 [Pedobacter sp. HMF7647]|uniref:CN hydrolase domain-containing protein n=1 Tax=Hufsiella arboris TaxID=2695275 RepID=A0A7K1Y9U8_9SPHI|nr:nitrilase-related carbon-nitrogen hydrolase [Hufsiella arboris]MXV51111.1 hypothetical protein [Hufsiella arboris]